jgi:hypothetical protein
MPTSPAGPTGPALNLARVITYQPHPSSGQPTEPERPAVPAPVRTAVKVTYAGTAVSAASLITSLAYLRYLIGATDAISDAHLSLPGAGWVAAPPGTAARRRCIRSSC